MLCCIFQLPGRRIVTESYVGGFHFKRDIDLLVVYRSLLDDITRGIMDELVRAVALTTSYAAQIEVSGSLFADGGHVTTTTLNQSAMTKWYSEMERAGLP